MMIEPTMQESVQETPPVEMRPASRNALSRRHSPAADLIKAHVALMEREVILLRQGDLFRLVQHHYHRLQSWHDQHTGWRIQRSSTVIRLVRHVSARTPGYLYERLRDPRDFACLTWTLWYAENRQLSGRGNDQQFLLSQLAEQIQEQSAYDGNEAAFDFRRPADRYSIQRALHYLQDLGGLQLVDGQTREWVEQATNADVLYEFTDVARSLVGALNPQVVASAAERLTDPAALLQPTKLQEAAGTPPLVRAWRALILGPAFFRFDDPLAYDELLRHLDGVANELLETFGWLLDVQRDYAMIVRASGMATGPVTALTAFGSNDQIAMLLCAAMRAQVTTGAWPGPDAYGCLHVMTEDMSELFYAVRERYGESWGNEARNKSARSLLNDVYRKMRQAGILRGPDEAGNVLILPIAARYSASYDQSERSATPRSRTRAKAANKKAIAAELPGLDEA